MSVFTTLAAADRSANPDSVNQRFTVHKVSRESEFIGAMSFLSFPLPVGLLVSRWYPGYRVTSLTGADAEEAVAILLGTTISTIADLNGFRRVLSTPGIAENIITALLPRAGIPVRARKYTLSEDSIEAACKAELLPRGMKQSDAIVAAYTHAIIRVLSAQGLVDPSFEKRMVTTSDSLAITTEDMRRIIMIEAMRGTVSESRIQQTVKYLDQEATPQIIGSRIGEMFRQFATAIPEIQLRIQQFDLVVRVVQLFNVDPQSLPRSLEAHPALIELASIANFIIFSSTQSLGVTLPAKEDTQEIKDACNAILLVIRSAPSIESIPLKTFAEYFGEVPSSAPEGIRRGLVVFTAKGQTSKMDVVNVVPKPESVALALVDQTYVPASGVATPLTNTLLAPAAMAGLANIVADELSLQETEMRDDCTFDPTVLTIQVSDADLTYLALAKATSVAFIQVPGDIRVGVSNAVSLLYGCTVAEEWRMAVLAATPSVAFFLDPAAVVLYTSNMTMREPRALPSRSQTIQAQVSNDVRYVNDAERFLDRSIESPFKLDIPITPYGSVPLLLKLKIVVLGALVGYEGEPIDRGAAYYASVKEPGVDSEVNLMLELALAYAILPPTDVQGDKARSWLIVNLAPILLHPSVRAIAVRAVNQAVIDAKVDGRKLAPQMRELYSRAFFGTALVILNRFGKLSADATTGLTNAIPVSTLSLPAAITLANLPSAINGAKTR